jgi:hypothetical protein
MLLIIVIRTGGVQSVNPYDSVGVIHNEVLSYHYCNMSPHDTNHFDEFVYKTSNIFYVKKALYDTLRTNTKNALLQRGWSINKINQDLNLVDEIFTNSGMFITVNGIDVIKDIRYHMDDVHNYCLNMGYISQQEYSILSDIYQAYYDSEYNTVDSLLTELDLSVYDPSNVPEVFRCKAIYNYSSVFWSDGKNAFNSTRNDIHPNKNDKTLGIFQALFQISADAVFIETGPGSLFASTIGAAVGYIVDYSLEEPCTCPVCRYYGMCE